MLILKCHLEYKHDIDFMIVDISKQFSEPYLWSLILPASQTEIKRKICKLYCANATRVPSKAEM